MPPLRIWRVDKTVPENRDIFATGYEGPVKDPAYNQRLFRLQGYYHGQVDGFWGPKSKLAWKNAMLSFLQTQNKFGKLADRSERVLFGLDPRLVVMARTMLSRVNRDKLEIKVISGLRSDAEQAALYNQGRFGDKRPRVTKARPGYSLHNFGLAFDIGIFKDGVYVKDDDAPYRLIGSRVAADVNLRALLSWGGTWKKPDNPHYEWAGAKESLAEIRESWYRP